MKNRKLETAVGLKKYAKLTPFRKTDNSYYLRCFDIHPSFSSIVPKHASSTVFTARRVETNKWTRMHLKQLTQTQTELHLFSLPAVVDR